MLDYISGSKLLFFYMGNSPEGPGNSLKKNFYRKLNYELNYPTLNDPIAGESAFSLALALGIPSEDLPCIVLTSDLSSGRYVWFKTCLEKIESQFTTLGRLAFRTEKHTMLTNFTQIINDQKNNIDLCNGCGQNNDDEMLAKKLTEFLSFLFTQDDKIKIVEKQQSKEIANETLVNLFNELILTQGINNEINIDACLKIASFSKMLCPSDFFKIYSQKSPDFHIYEEPQNNYNWDNFEDCMDLMESKSYYLINLGINVSTYLRGIGLISAENLENFKFTPSLICLTTAFETEINYSITSWIRKYLGIPMPEMYGKGNNRQPVGTNITGRFINFNNGDRMQKWIPPGIGETYHIFKILKTNLNGFPGLTGEDFINKWYRISMIRNPLSHEGVGPETAYNEILGYWKYFKAYHIISQWSQLKQSIRNK